MKSRIEDRRARVSEAIREATVGLDWQETLDLLKAVDRDVDRRIEALLRAE